MPHTARGRRTGIEGQRTGEKHRAFVRRPATVPDSKPEDRRCCKSHGDMPYVYFQPHKPDKGNVLLRLYQQPESGVCQDPPDTEHGEQEDCLHRLPGRILQRTVFLPQLPQIHRHEAFGMGQAAGLVVFSTVLRFCGFMVIRRFEEADCNFRNTVQPQNRTTEQNGYTEVCEGC